MQNMGISDDKPRTRFGALAPNQTVLEREVEQAVNELKRPAVGVIMSGLIAGFGIGASVLAIAFLMGKSIHISPLTLRLMMANAYAVGFVLVILSHSDLFTEYTTIALLPVMTGRSRLGPLARLWAYIYASNLTGCFLFAWILVTISPGLEIATHETFLAIGSKLVDHPWWLILLSACLAGWLMGLMGWLVSSSRDTIGQIVFVWIIAAVIGLGHLHHSIVGAVEIFAALLVAGPIGVTDTIRFLLLATTGNIIGGAVFAAIIRFSVLIIGEKGRGRSSGSS